MMELQQKYHLMKNVSSKLSLDYNDIPVGNTKVIIFHEVPLISIQFIYD